MELRLFSIRCGKGCIEPSLVKTPVLKSLQHILHTTIALTDIIIYICIPSSTWFIRKCGLAIARLPQGSLSLGLDSQSIEDQTLRCQQYFLMVTCNSFQIFSLKHSFPHCIDWINSQNISISAVCVRKQRFAFSASNFFLCCLAYLVMSVF